MTLKMASVFLLIFGAFGISVQTNRDGRGVNGKLR
jgi:hypothetical protein